MTAQPTAIGMALAMCIAAAVSGCSGGDGAGPLSIGSDCLELTIEFDPPVLTPETVEDGEPFLVVTVTDENGELADGARIWWELAGAGIGLKDRETVNGKIRFDRDELAFDDLPLTDRSLAVILASSDDLLAWHERSGDTPYCDGPEVRLPVDWPPPDPSSGFGTVEPPHPLEPRD